MNNYQRSQTIDKARSLIEYGLDYVMTQFMRYNVSTKKTEWKKRKYSVDSKLNKIYYYRRCNCNFSGKNENSYISFGIWIPNARDRNHKWNIPKVPFVYVAINYNEYWLWGIQCEPMYKFINVGDRAEIEMFKFIYSQYKDIYNYVTR